MKRARYERGNKHTTSSRTEAPRRPEAAPITDVEVEKELSLDDAKARRAALEQEAKDQDEKELAARKERDATLTKAKQNEEAASQRQADRERREKAKALPALLAEQKSVEDARVQKVKAITEEERRAYAAKIDGWCTIIHQRLGSINNWIGQEGPRVRLVAQTTYASTPKYWSVDLRQRYVKQAQDAQTLLDLAERQQASYVYALGLADTCKRTGPPSGEYQRKVEQDMWYAVGVNGNGYDEFNRRVYNRPQRDWIVDPEVVNRDQVLTDAVFQILQEGAAIAPDTIQPQRHVDEGLKDQRAAVKEDIRRKAEIEKRKSPVEKQTRGIVDDAAFGLNEF